MRLFILFLLMINLQVFAATDAVQSGIQSQESTKLEIGALEIVPFEGVQYNCRQVSGITFGANGHWANCQVTRGRWVATIDMLDLYQAQYCLGNSLNSCEQTAQVMFANRAYTQDATVLLVRVDEAGTRYLDPLIVNSDDDSVMSMSIQTAAGNINTQYFVWRADRWAAIDAQQWKNDLLAKLPLGTSARQVSALPDLENMRAEVPLFNTQDADCCPSGGVANVAIGLKSNQFIIKNLAIQP